jgi:hypothetical protein
MKINIMALIISGAWISLSEFVRNELLFKSYWINKYAGIGLHFPSEPVNNALWGVWSFLLAGAIVFLTAKLRFLETIVVAWTMAFVMMWLVVGNLNVLPLRLLLFAVPLSLLEVTIAALLSKKILEKKNRTSQ